MQRTNRALKPARRPAPVTPDERAVASPRRAVVLVGGVALGGMTALCLPFLVAGTQVPGPLLLVGRWIPAVASLVALYAVRHEGGVLDWWQLRPGGRRRLLAGVGAAIAVGGAIAGLGYGLARVTGLVGANDALPSLPAVVGIAVATAIVAAPSTLGEEVAWRAHLRLLTRRHGFWVSSLGIGAFWCLWHVPLHASYVLAGVMPAHVVAASTLVLVAVAPVWAALAERFGSVWPAVVAHAFPVTPFVLAGDVGGIAPWRVWALAGIWAAVALAAAAALAPRRGGEGRH